MKTLFPDFPDHFQATVFWLAFLVPALLLTAQPAEAFLNIKGIQGHPKITRNGIKDISIPLSDGSPLQFTSEAIKEVIKSNLNVDSDSDLRDDPKYHVDNESFTESNAFFNKLRDAVIGEISKDSAETGVQGSNARQFLGQALHILQDYYSHSNWVERNNTFINPDFGAPDFTPELAPDGTDLCLTLPGPPSSFYIPGADYSTSGFVGEEILGLPHSGVCATPPTGKCRHGLPVVCPGLAKDVPLYPGHEEAAGLAIAATEAFVRQILNDPRVAGNDDAIRALLGHEKPLEEIIYHFQLVTFDGVVITPGILPAEEDIGMVIYICEEGPGFCLWAGTGYFEYLNAEHSTSLTYNGGWTLTVPRSGTLYGEEYHLRGNQFWIEFIISNYSLDLYATYLLLLEPGSYAITLPEDFED